MYTTDIIDGISHPSNKSEMGTDLFLFDVIEVFTGGGQP
jgi:hypothetical protein